MGLAHVPIWRTGERLTPLFSEIRRHPRKHSV
jgi:hypothetical protein